MKTILLIGLFFFPFFEASVTAQSHTKELQLNEAIDAALSQNNRILQASVDEKIASGKLKEASGIFLPRIDFSYTSLISNNPLNAFGFKLQQKIVSPADFNPDLLNHPSATADFTTKLEVQQPLLNIDMLYQRRSAEKQLDMYRFITQRTKEYLAFETEKGYLQLQLAYETDSVLKEALNTAKAFYKNSKDYYDQGLIQKSDMLNAELHEMNIEAGLKNSGSAILDASDELSLLMGQPTGIIYTTGPVKKTMQADSLAILADRADFKALQKGIESYEMMIKSSGKSYLPRLNAFASWQLNDKSMIKFNSNSYLLGVQLSWNIFNRGNVKKLISRQSQEKDKLTLQLQKEKEEAQFSINRALRQLSDAEFAMKQLNLAIQQAAEALRVLQNRYSQGLVKTADVLMAQTQLSQQKLGYVQAIFNYNLAAAYLRFVNGK